MEQGFALPGAVLEGAAARLPHAHPVAHHAPSHAPKPAAETADVAARAASLTIAEAKGERQAEQHLRGVQSTLMKPVMFEFFGMMATPVSWAANKLNLTRVNTAIRSVLRAPALALREIKTKDAFQLPSAFMGQVANQATEARATGWASSAAATSERLASKGEVCSRDSLSWWMELSVRTSQRPRLLFSKPR